MTSQIAHKRSGKKCLPKDHENSKILSKINDLLNEYKDIKLNLPILVLLAPSKYSRAKKAPRPQNKYLLFRRNYSKGNPRPVGDSSQITSSLWKLTSEREKDFWKKLSIIAKEKHTLMFPDYKYSPDKKKKRKQCKVSVKREGRSFIPSPSTITLNQNLGKIFLFFFFSQNFRIILLIFFFLKDHLISPSFNEFTDPPNLTLQTLQPLPLPPQPQLQLPPQPQQPQLQLPPQPLQLQPQPQPQPQLQLQQLIDPYYIPVELLQYYQPTQFTFIPTIPITIVGNSLHELSDSVTVNPDPLLLNLDDYNSYYYPVFL
jgi:hypothetical protein